MTDRDIVDAIDEQLAQGEPETGYDFDDPTFPECPHSWCDREWHGLAITQNIEQMRWSGSYDEDYRYSEDDTPVICPGSSFDGEFTPPVPESPSAPEYAATPNAVPRGYTLRDLALRLGTWDIPDDPLGDSQLWMPNPFLPNGSSWQPLTGSASTLTHGPQWWRCDDVRRHGIRLDTERYREVNYTVPGRVMFPAATRVIAGHERILMRPDYDVCASAISGFNRETGDEWMEIHCETPPVTGNWYLRDETAILDLAHVRRLEQLIFCLTVVEEVYASMRNHLNEEMAHTFTREARTHFPGVWIDSRDLVYCEVERDRSRHMRVIEVRWRQPRSEQVELRDGPANGHTQEAGDLRTFDRINVRNPVRITSFREPVEPTAQMSTTSYQLAGFNTVTRNVVFRPVNAPATQPDAPAPITLRRWLPGDPQPASLLAAPVGADLTDSLGWQALRDGGWQEIGTVDRNAVTFTPTDEGSDITAAVGFVRNMHTAATLAGDSERDAILAEYARIPGYSPSDQRHIIIASRSGDARRYARQHGIRHPIIVDLERSHPEDVLRGLNLDGCRIHEIAGGLVPQHIIETLRMLAAFAGRPLESFYATNDTTEQAA
jgi:hypothetical protein